MRDLEEELDAQVAKIEAEIKEQARLENEQVKKEMQLKLEAEKAELLDHLRFVQKVSAISTCVRFRCIIFLPYVGKQIYYR